MQHHPTLPHRWVREFRIPVRAHARSEPQCLPQLLPRLRGRVAALPGVTSVEAAENGLVVFTDGRGGLLPELVAATGDNLRDISVSETTLESVFIKLTGRDLRD